MAIKRMILAITFTLLAAAVSAPVFAKPRFYNVTVVQVGLGGSTALIRLTDVGASGAFTKKWFRLRSASRNEMLALAMAAVTSGVTLKVKTDLESGGKPEILVMYLQES